MASKTARTIMSVLGGGTSSSGGGSPANNTSTDESTKKKRSTRNQIMDALSGKSPAVTPPVTPPAPIQVPTFQQPEQKQLEDVKTSPSYTDPKYSALAKRGEQELQTQADKKYGLGNIDLTDRNTGLYDENGKIMTVDSIGITDPDGKQVVIPTVVKKDGKWVHLTPNEAEDWYYKTGEYLGKFDTIDEANAYAQKLHEDQDKLYGDIEQPETKLTPDKAFTPQALAEYASTHEPVPRANSAVDIFTQTVNAARAATEAQEKIPEIDEQIESTIERIGMTTDPETLRELDAQLADLRKQKQDYSDAITTSQELLNRLTNPQSAEPDQWDIAAAQQREHQQEYAALTNQIYQYESYLGMADSPEQVAAVSALLDPLLAEQRRMEEEYGIKNPDVASGYAFRGAIHQGADQFVGSITNFIDSVVGEPLQEVWNILGLDQFDNPVTALNKFVNKETEQNQKFFGEKVEGDPEAERILKYGTTTAAAIPAAALAYMTAGTSAMTTAGLESAAYINSLSGAEQTLAQIGNAVTQMSTSPNFIASFMQEAGQSYKSAIDDGMDTADAAVYSYLYGYLSAIVEVGGTSEIAGGLQQYLQDGKVSQTGLKDYVKSIVGEVGEENTQGMLERGLKTFFGQDTAVYSNDPNKNAIINPKQMGEEAKGALVVSALLGGGQLISDVNANATPAQTQTQNVETQSVENALTPEMQASQIVRDEAARQVFEDQNGIKLPASNTEAERVVSQILYEQRRAAQPQTVTEAVPETAPEATPETVTEAAPETVQPPAEYSPAQNRVIDILTQPKGVNYSDANKIISDPELWAAYQQLFPETNTAQSKSNLKEAVKNTDLSNMATAEDANPVVEAVTEAVNPTETPTEEVPVEQPTVQPTAEPTPAVTPTETPTTAAETPTTAAETPTTANPTVTPTVENTTPELTTEQKIQALIDSAKADGQTITYEDAARIVQEAENPQFTPPVVNENPNSPILKRSQTESNTLSTVAEQYGGEIDDIYYIPQSEKQSMMEAASRLRNDRTGEMARLMTKDQFNNVEVDEAMTIYGELWADGIKNHDMSAAQAWGKAIQPRMGENNARALQALAKWTRGSKAVVSDAIIDLADTNLPQAKQAEIAEKLNNFQQRYEAAVNGEDGNVNIDDLKKLIKDMSDYRGTGTLVKSNFDKVLNNIAESPENIDWMKEFALRQMQAIPSDFTQKVSLARKLKSWQTLSQLFRLTTFKRNIGGNVSFSGIDALVQDTLGIAIDHFVGNKTGAREVGYNNWWFSSEARKAAGDNFNKSVLEVAADIDMTGDANRYGIRGGRTFKANSSNPFERALSRFEQVLSYSLSTSDRTSRGQIEAANVEGIRNANAKRLSADTKADVVASTPALAKAFEKVTGEQLTGNRKTDRANIANRADEIIDTLTNLPQVEGRELTRAESALLNALQYGRMTDERAAAIAEQMADYDLFQNEGYATALSRGAHDVLNTIGLGGTVDKTGRHGGFGLGDLANPYPAVPANLAVKALEYSPANIIKGGIELSKVLSDYKNGVEVDAGKQAQAVMDISRGMSGVPIVALLAALFKTGAVKNADDEEDLDVAAQNRAEGKTGVQWNLSATNRLLNGESGKWEDGDDLISVGFLEPLNAFMAIASMVADSDENFWTATRQNYLAGAIQSVLDMPVMQSIANVVDTFKYADDEQTLGSQVGEAALKFAGDSASGMLPSAIFSQLAKGLDDTYRSTKGDTAAESVVNSFISNIPFARETLDPVLDNFGNEKKYTGSDVQRWLNQYFFAGPINKVSQTDAGALVEDLYKSTGNADAYPNRKAPSTIRFNNESQKLTTDEQNQYQKTYGKAVSDMIENMTHGATFNGLSDEEKVSALKEVYSYASYLAKKEFAESRGLEYESDDFKRFDKLKDPAEGIVMNKQWDDASKDGEEDFDALDRLTKRIIDMEDSDPALAEMMSNKKNAEGLKKAAKEDIGAEDHFALHDLAKTLSDAASKVKETGEDVRDYPIIEKGLELYADKVQDEAAEDIYNGQYSWLPELRDAKAAGVDAKTWFEFHDQIQDIQNGERTDSQKNMDIHNLIDNSDLTPEQKQLLKDQHKVYTTFAQKDGKYDAMVNGGVDADRALWYVDNWQTLIPEEGKDEVSGTQKAMSILKTPTVNGVDVPPSERMDAVLAGNVKPRMHDLAVWMSKNLSQSEINRYWKACKSKGWWKRDYEYALKHSK